MVVVSAATVAASEANMKIERDIPDGVKACCRTYLSLGELRENMSQEGAKAAPH